MQAQPSSPAFSSFDETPRVMRVDVEHLGIRLLIPIMALIGFGGGFVLGRIISTALEESVGTLCFSLVFAFVGMGVMLQIGEQLIKPRWSSGRHLEVSTRSLKLRDRRRGKDNTTTIQWQSDVTSTAYFWEVETGKSRVRKGWYCVAVQLRQDEEEVVLYTFMSPDDAQGVPHFNDWFFRLLPRKSREELQQIDPREAARQERYRKIESFRFFDGAEVQPEDFQELMTLIVVHTTSPPQR